MDLHQNARLTLYSREQLALSLITGTMTLNAAAAAFNVSTRTARKWLRRYRLLGRPGLYDRSSRPLHSPHRTSEDRVRLVETLRRQRWTGLRIAHTTGLSRATVSRILRRLRLNRVRDLEPVPPVVRYEHPEPGDLLHLDTKKLARIVRPGHRIHGDRSRESYGAGWEFLHVAIDDHSRIAFSQILPDECFRSAIFFLRAALDDYARFGIRIRRLLTDNGSCYRSRQFRRACRLLGLQQRFTRPYTPRTNGKAERFIQTALREWAYARSYPHSHARTTELPTWLHLYNWHRPHASLGSAPPISRSRLRGNNLLILHI